MNLRRLTLMGVGFALAGSIASATETSVNSDSSGAPSLRTATISLSPQVGSASFTDGNGNYAARGVAGLMVEANLSSLLGEGPTPFDLGVTTGGLYSHLGSSTANFFGIHPDQASQPAGSNLLISPVDLKFGYYLTDKARVSVHGGGNVMYSTSGNSAHFGQGTWDSDWRAYPNAGADLEVAVASNVNVVVRPDLTFFTTGDTLLTGTVGINVALF